MSRRLTKAMVDTLTNAVVTHATKDRKAALRTREDALAQEVYEALFTAEDRDRMNALPDGWLPVAMSFGLVNAEGYTFQINLIHPLRIPNNKQIWHTKSSLLGKAEKSVLAKLERFIKAADAFTDEKRQLESKTMGTLKSFNTTKKLAETWPEMLPFLKAHDFLDEPMKLPACIPVGLNKALSLPV